MAKLLKADERFRWSDNEDYMAYSDRVHLLLKEYEGKTIKFGVADGYALYEVVCRTGNAYQVPAAMIRGLRAVDIEAQLGVGRGRKSFFGSRGI